MLGSTVLAAAVAFSESQQTKPQPVLIVKPGDTLSGMALRVCKNPEDWTGTWVANKWIKDPNLIYPNWRVRMACKTVQVTAPQPVLKLDGDGDYDNDSSDGGSTHTTVITAAQHTLPTPLGTPAPPAPVPDSLTGNAALGQEMAAAYGWGGGYEWVALNNIVMSESGWSATVTNPYSGAAGIAQNISGFSASYPDGDARAQIAWLLAYIQSRYITPAQAWAFHVSHGWY